MKKLLSICLLLMVGGTSLTILGCADKKAEETGVVTAEKALTLLQEGNARFVDMKMKHPKQSAERREETSTQGQSPFAVVLGCADSRVPVETVFDRGIGDIFTVEVAGNIAADSSVIGSLEYGAGNLKAPLMVILGHTQCGAVGAAISGAKLEGDIRDIQKRIEPVAKKVKVEYPDLQGEALATEVTKANVFQVEKDLLAESKEIRARVQKGELEIVPALYDVKTGKVEWLKQNK